MNNIINFLAMYPVFRIMIWIIAVLILIWIISSISKIKKQIDEIHKEIIKNPTSTQYTNYKPFQNLENDYNHDQHDE